MYETEQYIEEDELLVDVENAERDFERDENEEEKEPEEERSKEGREEDWTGKEERPSPYKFNGKEMVNAITGQSWVKELGGSLTAEQQAAYRQMFKQWSLGGDPRFRLDDFEKDGTLYITHLILRKDGFVTYEITSTKLSERVAEDEPSEEFEDERGETFASPEFSFGQPEEAEEAAKPELGPEDGLSTELELGYESEDGAPAPAREEIADFKTLIGNSASVASAQNQRVSAKEQVQTLRGIVMRRAA